MKRKYCIPVDEIFDIKYIYYRLRQCLNVNPFFFLSEINTIEKTTANPVDFGATHTQTVSDIIRIG